MAGVKRRHAPRSTDPESADRISPDTPDRALVAVVHRDIHPGAEDTASTLATVQGVRQTLERYGQVYKIFSASEFRERPLQSTCPLLLGVVFIERNYGDRDLTAKLEQAKIPVVVAKLERREDVSGTCVDHAEVSLQAVRVCANLGHQRIAFIGREVEHCFYRDARKGYVAGLKEAGISVDKSLIAECEQTNAHGGYVATRLLLKNQASAPSAIIAARDAIASGVCRAIKDVGLVVGLHISVVGFDDVSWPEAANFLTTFQEPCYEMGAAAAEMLIQRLNNVHMANEMRRFATPLLLRRSAGPRVKTSQSSRNRGPRP